MMKIMFNFSIKESLNKLKLKKYDKLINKNIDYLNNYDEYQLELLIKSEGLKLNNLIRLNFIENVGFNCYNIQQERYGRLPLCRNIENFLNEKYQESLTGTVNIIEFLKFEINKYDTWEEFIEQQKIGDSQNISYQLEEIGKKNNLPVKCHFGEIVLDNYYYDNNTNDEVKTLSHHWITINDDIVEFSKGALKNYIEWNNLYDVYCESENIYEQVI